jgi:hypothetical protein
MDCLLCGKSIGTLRRLVDRKYCCTSHKNMAERSFRDEYEPERFVAENAASATNWFRTAAALIGAFLVVLVVGVLSFSNAQANGRGVSSEMGVRGWFASSARSVAPVTYSDDFVHESSGWITGTVFSSGGVRYQLGSGEWSATLGGSRLGALRLFKPTLHLRDYDITFRATILDGGVGWAFRAEDAGTLYAAKLLLNAYGPDSNGCLQRFTRVRGDESARTCEASPVMIERGTPYTIRMLVSGDHFSMFLNGVWLATWTDSRVASGAAGFFVENGEDAVIHSVTVSERDSLLGRLVAYLSWIRTPVQ